MFTKQQTKILGLHASDMLILDVLKEQMSVSALAEKIDIPRTSLYLMLSKLNRRGFIRVVVVGKRKQWQALSSVDMKELLEKLYVYPHNTALEKVRLHMSENTGFMLYRGQDHLIQLYKRMLRLNKHERLYIIQPNQSTEMVLRKYPFNELVEINNFIKDNKIIVEAVLHENAFDHFFETLKKEQKTGREIQAMFQSFADRVADTTYISKELLDFKAEIYIMGPVALILNWEEEVAVEIKNPDMVGMLKGFFEFIKHYGRKVDQNPMIAKLLEKFEVLESGVDKKVI